MPRQFLKKALPSYATIRESWYLRPFRALLHDPSLWATHRKAVVPAVATSIFIAFLPIPLHPLLAAVAALMMRVNLPVSLAVVWVTNPVTIAPIWFTGYALGSWLLGRQIHFSGDVTILLSHAWQPLLLGLLFMGVVFSLLAYFLLNILWRWATLRRMRRRRN